MRVGSTVSARRRICALVLAVGDEIGDPQDLQMPCSAREALEVRHARHRAVLVHDLADHAGGLEPREAREIDRRLGMPAAREHAAVDRAQRLQPARAGSDPPGRVPSAIATAMVRARSCADMPEPTPSRASIGVANAVPNRVWLPVSSVMSERPSSRMRSSVSASETSPRAVRGHEVDRLGRRALGRDEEIAFVLAVLVVHEDHHPALAHVGQDAARR